MNAKTETEFADGLIVKAPRENAPDYVIGSLSIRREAFIAWLQSRDGEWVNLDMKRGQSGKWYAAVDNWRPSGERSAAPTQANRGGQKYGGKRELTKAESDAAYRQADEFGDGIPF